MNAPKYTSSWLQPLKAAFKFCLPNIAEAASGIKQEFDQTPELKADVKKNFGISLALDALETALWIVPMKLLPKSFFKIAANASSKVEGVALGKNFLVTLPRELVGLWDGLFDAKVFNALAKTNRQRIKRELGNTDSQEEEKQGTLSAALETLLDIRAGLATDTSLRAKFIGLAALEIVSDVTDVKMGLSRNIPGLVASLMVSPLIGLKELDWIAKAFKLGVERRLSQSEEDLANSPVIKLMSIVGMQKQASAVSKIINADPDLTKLLDNSNKMIHWGTMAAIGGVASMTTEAMNGSLTKKDLEKYVIAEILSLSYAGGGVLKALLAIGSAYKKHNRLSPILG